MASSDLVSEFLVPNAFIYNSNVGATIYDLNCCRRSEGLGYIKVLASWLQVVPKETALAPNGVSYAVSTKQLVIPMKNTMIQFDSDTGENANFRIFVVSLADSGNKHLTTSGTLNNVITNSDQTGVNFSAATRLTYRDA